MRKSITNKKGKEAMSKEGKYATTSAYRKLLLYGFNRRAYIQYVKWGKWYRPEHAMPALAVRYSPVQSPRKQVLIKRVFAPTILAGLDKKAA